MRSKEFRDLLAHGVPAVRVQSQARWKRSDEGRKTKLRNAETIARHADTDIRVERRNSQIAERAERARNSTHDVEVRLAERRRAWKEQEFCRRMEMEEREAQADRHMKEVSERQAHERAIQSVRRQMKEEEHREMSRRRARQREALRERLREKSERESVRIEAEHRQRARQRIKLRNIPPMGNERCTNIQELASRYDIDVATVRSRVLAHMKRGNK